MNTEEHLVLIDKNDEAIGSEEKLAAHQQGLLHRAFSVFIFSSDGKLMLQKRADGKYHSGGLWTNTCCGHPRPGELVDAAAQRRLQEEMRFSCDLSEKFIFAYQTSFPNGLIENEIDHVFFGEHDIDPEPDPNEASDWRWIDLDSLEQELRGVPQRYTFWLHNCFARVKEEWPARR